MVSVRTDVSPPEGRGRELLAGISSAVAEELGKPVDYVMAELQGAEMLMSGRPGPTAAVDVRSIGGLDRELNARLAERIGELLQSHLGVRPERAYIVFTDVDGENWAWKGRTFR
jgi:phenylpyruvate tautomerase PptA (4-oxalocrotonate tautomerase family)